MKAGIFVHTQSGHTALLCRSLGAALNKAGFETDIQLLRPTTPAYPRARNIVLANTPDP
jgi:flavodoxin